MNAAVETKTMGQLSLAPNQQPRAWLSVDELSSDMRQNVSLSREWDHPKSLIKSDPSKFAMFRVQLNFVFRPRKTHENWEKANRHQRQDRMHWRSAVAFERRSEPRA